MFTNYHFIVEAGADFKGYFQSSGYYDDSGIFRIHYTDNLSLAEYEEEKGKKFKILSDSESDELIENFEKSLITQPEEIPLEKYDYALEVLPPCRYDGNVFHMPERLRSNLVSWYFRKNGKAYTFVNQANLSCNELKTIIESI